MLTFCLLLLALAVPLSSPARQIHFERLADREGLYKRTITCGIQDSAGFMWFGSEDGIIWLGSFGGGVTRFNSEEMVFTAAQHQGDDLSSLSSNLVWCLLKSRDGVMWISTDGDGLNKFIKRTLQFNHTVGSTDAGGLAYNGVNGIAADQSGLLWMANDGGGVQTYDLQTKKARQYVHEPDNQNSLSSDLTETIFVDHQGIVWGGTYNGGLKGDDPAAA